MVLILSNFLGAYKCFKMTFVVNFTDILQAAFVPIFFQQKIALQNHKVEKISANKAGKIGLPEVDSSLTQLSPKGFESDKKMEEVAIDSPKSEPNPQTQKNNELNPIRLIC